MPDSAPSSTSRKTPLSSLSHDELLVACEHFVGKQQKLEGQVAELTRQLEWFKNQLFGQKSEKRVDPNPHQMMLGEAFAPPEPGPDMPQKTITYTRGVGPKVRPEDCVTKEGLRFGPDVPVKTIRLPVPGIEGLDDIAWVLIDTKVVRIPAHRDRRFRLNVTAHSGAS